MRPKTQKPLTLINKCNAIFDSGALIRAIYWYSKYPVCKEKYICIHGRYPAISIYDEKIHIHRILMMWNIGRRLMTDEYVHHIDGNRLNNLLSNLTIMTPSEHQSKSNKGRKFSQEHRKKIGEANRNRKGIKYRIYSNPKLLNPSGGEK